MSENKKCSNSGCDKASCEGCSSNTSAGKSAGIQKEPQNVQSHIQNVVGIASGKGGVGKSFVTASLANEMAVQGFKVGILDADITGPSIPKMYGLTEMAKGTDEGIVPAVTENGIKVMSINLLLPQEETPVIWRGPILANMVKQFWTDVIWGELDYLFVDMPPGTGDVPLTAFQSLPVDGIVIVSTPQDLVQMIVKKAYNMAEMMKIPVLGLVENYSYLKCPDCGKEIALFGVSKAEETCEQLEIPLIARIPLDPEMTLVVNAGQYAKIRNEELKGVEVFLPVK